MGGTGIHVFFRGSVVKRLAPVALLSLAVVSPGLAAPAPRPAAKARPKPAAARPSAPVDPDLLSEGKEAVLVDRLKPEVTNVVLFYRPDNAEEAELAEALRKRVTGERKVAVKWVRLKSADAPIARQYEVATTPQAFVYDRNKNLLGKAGTFTEIGMLVGKGTKVARLKWVDEADPTAAEVYRAFGGGTRPVPEIMKTLSLKPGAMELVHQLSRYHFTDGFLSVRYHELIASYVSALNKCKY